ncbi:TPA: C39 family peptidase [Bacillus thuringiensis]|nr:C39 family peptidase [Bacillus thuringiensis]
MKFRNKKIFIYLLSVILLGGCMGVPIYAYLEKHNVLIWENNKVEVKKSITTKTIKPLNVPLILQKPELMRGCEVTSLAMILQFVGVQVDKMELAHKLNQEPFQKNGLNGNMHKGFVGDMYTFDENGLGAYVEPIIELAKKYVSNKKVLNLSHTEPKHLYETIDKGLPVWVLSNAKFKELSDDQFLSWNTDAGVMDVTYQQHSVVITDYDENYVYVNDPLREEKNRRLDREDFEKAWIQMGRQAMAIAF